MRAPVPGRMACLAAFFMATAAVYESLAVSMLTKRQARLSERRAQEMGAHGRMSAAQRLATVRREREWHLRRQSLAQLEAQRAASQRQLFLASQARPDPGYCPDARAAAVGVCAHGARRWVPLPCKKRSCPHCGPRGREQIAQRIGHGVQQLWAAGRVVRWHVLTLAEDVDKRHLVRMLAKYVEWLRRTTRNQKLVYAATYELTRRGRYHVNLLVDEYVDQRAAQAAWGAIVFIRRVDGNIGAEVAKSRVLSQYLSKVYQSPYEFRRCSYSRSWPKPPQTKVLERQGQIRWAVVMRDGMDKLNTQVQLGYWRVLRDDEVRAGRGTRGERVYTVSGMTEQCDCFHCRFVAPQPQAPPIPPPSGMFARLQRTSLAALSVAYPDGFPVG